MASLGNERLSHRDGTNVWLTPKWILNELGEFDLDPCSPIDRPWDTARSHYTINDDGLAQPWSGRVWLNPPYGRGMELWMEKLASHPDGGLALIFARTETRTFFETVWGRADAIFFFKGRIKFCTPDGLPAEAAQAPSVLVAYGEKEKKVLANLNLPGFFIDLEKGTNNANF